MGRIFSAAVVGLFLFINQSSAQSGIVCANPDALLDLQGQPIYLGDGDARLTQANVAGADRPRLVYRNVTTAPPAAPCHELKVRQGGPGQLFRTAVDVETTIQIPGYACATIEDFQVEGSRLAVAVSDGKHGATRLPSVVLLMTLDASGNPIPALTQTVASYTGFTGPGARWPRVSNVHLDYEMGLGQTSPLVSWTKTWDVTYIMSSSSQDEIYSCRFDQCLVSPMGTLQLNPNGNWAALGSHFYSEFNSVNPPTFLFSALISFPSVFGWNIFSVDTTGLTSAGWATPTTQSDEVLLDHASAYQTSGLVSYTFYTAPLAGGLQRVRMTTLDHPPDNFAPLFVSDPQGNGEHEANFVLSHQGGHSFQSHSTSGPMQEQFMMWDHHTGNYYGWSPITGSPDLPEGEPMIAAINPWTGTFSGGVTLASVFSQYSPHFYVVYPRAISQNLFVVSAMATANHPTLSIDALLDPNGNHKSLAFTFYCAN